MSKRRNKWLDIRVQFFFICMAGLRIGKVACEHRNNYKHKINGNLRIDL